MNDYQVDLSVAKPSGLSEKHASVFKDKSVTESYQHRPPYSEQIVSKLKELTPPQPRVLDIGCGCGDLTLLLTNLSDRIDAVDFSGNMIAKAKTRKLSDQVNWFVGKVEDQLLEGKYDLITSAQSLHWMEWEVVFSKLKNLLNPNGYLVVMDRNYAHRDWWTKQLTEVINRFSTNDEFTPYRIVEEIEQRGFFKAAGTHRTEEESFQQTVDELIEAFHSRNGLSRDRMDDGGVDFGTQMRDLLTPFSENGVLNLGTYTELTWGKVL